MKSKIQLFFIIFFIQINLYANDFIYSGFISELPTPPSSATKQFVSKITNTKFTSKTLFTKNEIQILIDDLSALYELKGNSVSNQSFFLIFNTGTFDGKKIFEWLMNKNYTIDKSAGRSCGDSKEDSYLGCFLGGSNEILLPPSFFKQSRLDRLAIFIHEKRHADGHSHVSYTEKSEDNYLLGSRGAEWSFLSALSQNCTNCLLLDKEFALKKSIHIKKYLIHLSIDDQMKLDSVQKNLKNFQEINTNAISNLLKNQYTFLYSGASICLNQIPYNEFKKLDVVHTLEDCLLYYYVVAKSDVLKNPKLLEQRKQIINGNLVILIPVKNDKI